MRRNFLSMMLAAAVLITGFTSCNNDEEAFNEGGNKTKKGEPTTMQLVIHAPKAPQTYAPTDNNATDAEIELKKVNVLIYEKTAVGYQLEQLPITLTMADFDVKSGSDTYLLKADKKISTFTGEKQVFVAVNFEGTLPATIGDPVTKLPDLVQTLTSPDYLSNSTSGFAMFSTKATDANLVAEDNTNYGTANTQKVTVKRMVAKISVQESASLRDGNNKIMSNGGELTEVEFALGNANKTSYLIQKVEGNVVKDNNWASFADLDFFPVNASGYKTVNDKNATVASVTPVYVPENTAEKYDVDGKNLTYVSVRAKYAPEFFCDGTGTSKGANLAAPKPFWTVTRDNGKLYYFDVEAEANTFLASYPTATKSPQYVDGYCYWRGYLNQKGTPDATITGSTVAKFDVLRNTYYKATITGIKAPGYPTDQGKVTEPTTLNMEVNIEPWQVVNDDWNL